MGNLERPRHGWEGLNNGGEIYGNSSSIQQPYEVRDDKLETFNNMVNIGVDRVLAYMLAYSISHEDAVQIVNQEKYNSLVSAGLPKEMAMEMINRSSKESSSKVR